MKTPKHTPKTPNSRIGEEGFEGAAAGDIGKLFTVDEPNAEKGQSLGRGKLEAESKPPLLKMVMWSIL